MAASRYRNFLRLLESWPVDKSKGQRDLGLHFRHRISQAFPQGEASPVDSAECDRVFASLHRISTDFHKRAWPRTSSFSSGASGATLEELNHSLSEAALEQMGERKSIFQQLNQSSSQK